MWKADVTIVALDAKLQNVAFVENFLTKTRVKAWEEASKFVGEIASRFTIVSLTVNINNLSN